MKNELGQKRFYLFATLAVGLLIPIIQFLVATHDGTPVNDDQRQHLFWMNQWHHDEGKKGDSFFSDYFSSISPILIKAVYYPPVSLGISPYRWAQIVCVFLFVLTAFNCYLWLYAMLPRPLLGFVATSLNLLSLSVSDIMWPAIARSAVIPLIYFFMFTLIKDVYWLSLTALIFMALVYPQVALILLGTYVMIWFTFDLIPSRPHPKLLLKSLFKFGVAASLCLGTTLIFKESSSSYGPLIRGEEARGLSVFQQGGRAQFFSQDLYRYFVCDKRSGVFPGEWGCTSFWSLYILLGFTVLCIWFAQRKPQDLLLHRRQGVLPIALLVSSVFFFFVAHLFLFRLHLPGRYMQFSLRALFVPMVCLFWFYLSPPKQFKATPFLFFLLISISLPMFLNHSYKWPKVHLYHPDHGETPEEHRAVHLTLESDPVYVLLKRSRLGTVYSLEDLAKSVPSYTNQSTYVSAELLIPYLKGFLRTFEARLENLGLAVFYPNQRLCLFAENELGRGNNIQYMMTSIDTFNSHKILEQWWVRSFPSTALSIFKNSVDLSASLSDDKQHLERILREAKSFFSSRPECLLAQSSLFQLYNLSCFCHERGSLGLDE